MFYINKIYKGVIIPVILAGMSVSCSNDLQEIRKITETVDGPDEVSKNVEILYTDKGNSRLRLTAPILHRYINEENAEIICPEGMVLHFFDTLGNLESTLRARKGRMNTETNFMRVEDSVIFENYKNERLDTEMLDIYFQEDSIFTDRFVKITSENAIISGTGLVSNGNFTKYRINKITDSKFILQD